MSFQAYLDNIKKKTGKSAEDFKKLAEKKGLFKPGIKPGEIVEWLKKDFGLGHGHSMAIYAFFKSYQPKEPADHAGKNTFPVKLTKPAERALANAGITSLEQLTKVTEEELSSFHGIGPNAAQQLKKALNDNGLSFAGSKK